MGMDISKPTQLSLEGVKLPPLDKPAWFDDVADELMSSDPPPVGLQVT